MCASVGQVYKNYMRNKDSGKEIAPLKFKKTPEK